MTGVTATIPRFQFFDDNGVLLVNGTLTTYLAGGTTPTTTWKDSALGTANTNPITLDARGECQLWLDPTKSYKFVLKNALGGGEWTEDNIRGASTAIDAAALTASFATSTGATLIGWIRTATGAIATTLSKWLNRQPPSVFDFMTDAQIADTQLATPLLDHTTAIQAFRDAIAGGTRRKKGVFPAGTYRYSVSPNWAIQDAEIIAEGDVRLRYFGVGNAVIFDADAADAVDPITGLVYNMRFGWGNPFIVEAPTTALHGVFVRSVHHSKIGINVRGAGAASAGLKVNFAVCTEFDVTCSVNEAGWYSVTKPAIGLDLDQRGANEQTSYCTFVNPIIEGPTTGIQLTSTLGNLFRGGTSEGCASYGVYAASGASGDRFDGTDFEANTTADAYVLGTGIVFDKCDSDNVINFGTTAVQGQVIGGRHKSILLDTSSSFCTVSNDTVYNRSNSGGTMTDGGTSNLPGNPLNAGTGVRFLTATELAYNPPNIPTGTMLQKTITVTGAKLGDKATASFSISLAASAITAAVTAADTVTVCFINLSGGGVDLGPGDLSVTVTRGA